MDASRLSDHCVCLCCFALVLQPKRLGKGRKPDRPIRYRTRTIHTRIAQHRHHAKLPQHYSMCRLSCCSSNKHLARVYPSSRSGVLNVSSATQTNIRNMPSAFCSLFGCKNYYGRMFVACVTKRRSGRPVETSRN